MRVLHLFHSIAPATGGPGEAVRQLARAAAGLGQRHEIVTLDGPGPAWAHDAAFPIHALGRPGHAPSRWGYAPALRPWLRRHGEAFDAWVVHGLWQYPGFVAPAEAQRCGTPYLVAPHGMLDPWFREQARARHLRKALYWKLIEHRVLQRACGVLFMADDESRRAQGSFRPYAVRPLVVGLGVAPPTSAAGGADGGEAFFAVHPTLRGRRVLLFLGRLHRKKGIDLLLDAFARTVADEPALALVVAGPDDDGQLAPLQARAHALGLGPQQLVWAGLLQGTMKWSALAAAEAFVLPSHQENFGLAVAEALAAGTPVLVSRRVAVWPRVVEAGAGLAEEDSAAGTLALLRAWAAATPAARASFRAAARACFAEHFEAAAAARRWAGAISGALGQPTV
jgi:glycosyltransferase involved in cell wall biosynthesis